MTEANPYRDGHIPLADAIRTTLLMQQDKLTALDPADTAGALQLAAFLMQCMQTWLYSLEGELGQGDVAAALQIAFDKARTSRDPMRAIVNTADLAGIRLAQEITTIDNLGLPVDEQWRDRRGIQQAGERR